MRWPNIFFRPTKRRDEPTPAPAFKSSVPGPRVLPNKTQAQVAAPTSPASNVDQAMAEADPIRTLRQTGGLRLSKRALLEAQAQTGPILARSETTAKQEPASPTIPAAAPPVETAKTLEPPVSPSVVAKEIPHEMAEAKPPEPSVAAAPAGAKANLASILEQAQPSPEFENSFLLPPDPRPTGPVDEPTRLPFAATITTSLRRKAKLTEVARLVTPSAPAKADEPVPAGPEPSGTVVPPAFTVATATGSVILAVKAETAPSTPSPAKEAPAPANTPAPMPEPVAKESSPAPESPKANPISTEPPPSIPSSAPQTEEKPSVPLEHLPIVAPQKKEFLLVNGERLFGTVLSETTDTIYLEHATLGVLTLPRSQIAGRPVEIILINGDRIVGDIMAETADTLYVRHASLGMLTVPRAQRSARVVEAILKDGDRILGEVLAETEAFTVIRSATLGTVTVPHDKVSMLNRKVEQIELKALAPALEDKRP